MMTPDLAPGGRDAAFAATYEDAFDEIWQQTCLGRFSVAEVKERLLALQERFNGPAAAGLLHGPHRQAHS